MTSSTARGPAAELDEWIASREGEGAPFDARALYEADLRDAFPTDAVRSLDDFGLARYYVPQQYGGELTSIPQVLSLWRVIARRDLTVAVAHGKTLLGAICVWIAGRPEQAQALGRAVLDGMVVSWGLTERGRGSDLMRSTVTLRSTDRGWRLNGEKWLINNATRGDAICVLARSNPRMGPRSLSLAFVEKSRLDAESFAHLPKEPTLGIRGADISGIAFHDAQLERDALVGHEGQGLETVLRALQVTRTVCVGLSLGALDHALATAYEFACNRQIHGRALIDLDMAAQTVAHAHLARAVVGTVAEVACRCLHVFPEQMSVISAITKAFVPTTVDETLAGLAELVGLRSFVADHEVCEPLEKIERDHRIVAIFDGSTVVTRNAVVSQFPILSREYDRARDDQARCVEAGGTSEVHPLALDGLELLSAHGCSLVQALPRMAAQLVEAAEHNASLQPSAWLAERIVTCTQAVIARARAIPPAAQQVEDAAFEVARDYELCFAAAACLSRWAHPHAHGDRSSHNTQRLTSCLDWILARLSHDHDVSAEARRWALDQLHGVQGV